MSQPPITPEQLAALPPEAQAIVKALIDFYEWRIAKLEARVRELESRLNKTPQDSSLPPSSQHPHAKPAPPREPSGKKRGGQPGHPKHERTLIPTDQCSEVVTVKPPACRRCGDRLAGNDTDPRRHQIWEVPGSDPS